MNPIYLRLHGRFLLGFFVMVVAGLLSIANSCSRVVSLLDESWEFHSTSHSIIKCKKNSYATSHISFLLETHESAYQRLRSQLQLAYTAPIVFHIYEDFDQSDFSSGEQGQAYPNNLTIELIFNEDTFETEYVNLLLHETTHILMETGVGTSGMVFFIEGIAEAMCNQEPVQFFPSVLTEQPLYEVMKLTLDEFYGSEYRSLYYAMAGSFSHFLISHYGIEHFKQCYIYCKRHNFSSKIEEIYGMSFFYLVELWENEIRDQLDDNTEF